MKKLKIQMLSSADAVAGQGVGSAYLEQISLVKESSKLDIYTNKKCKPDIIHHHTINPNYYIKMKLSKCPNIAYVHFLPHTLDESIKLPKFIFNIFKKYVISFYNSADYLVVVNPIFIEDLKKYKIDEKKIKYIPNFVSKDKFFKKNSNEKKSIRKKYGIENNKFVVVGAGQVQTRKGVKDFIEVAKKLPDIEFIWCGGFSFGKITDGYNELKQIMNNPPQNVKFLGIIPREEMNDIYNMADLFFLPSYNELFPMTILETSNTEIPILLRDLDLYKVILFDNYFKGTSNDEFVDIITKIKNDKELYHIGELKSKAINEFYSRENVLKMWEDFYQQVYDESNINRN